MSSLISSFLIEPVVRQARRFSRPSISSIDTPRQSSDRRHLNDEVAAPQVQVLPAAVTGEILGDTDYEELRNGTHDVSISRAIPGQPLVSSPTAVDGGLDAELEALEETRPGIVSALSRTSIRPSTSQRDLNRLDEETPNPLYGIPERFRSTNTSFSNSIHSLVEAQEGSPRRTTGQDSVRSLAGSYNSRIGNGTLPEDDGMGALRKRIVEIREMLVSNPEKARLMHDLMTEQHNSSQASLHALHVRGPRSPSSLLSLDKPLTPNSTNSSVENNTGDPFTPMSLSSAVDPLNPYNLDERALEPTFVPSPTPPIMSTDPIAEADEQESDDEEIATLGCPHYKRNVKLQCSACNRWYTCRFCHDEVEDHSLNRKETKNMLCMLCRCPQPAAEHCSECGERAAWYYCAICKLWDNDNEKSIYHCNDCGICRLGQGLGKDFYHCKVVLPVH
ncbi:MAG: hypothetical protein M1812_007189 [Candelaria pacifica]|nr:MAG: hypothetical protein M1812_007189 [Candelaria pacifica]